MAVGVLQEGEKMAKNKSKWISVGMRLPDVNVRVLALTQYRDGTMWQTIAAYRKCPGVAMCEWDDTGAAVVVSWQPLPEYPAHGEF